MTDQDPALADGRLTRPTVPALDDVLGKPVPVLDHGFIRVIDYMGDEAAVVQAARVSYGTGTKAVSEDRGLIRYLMRHRHSTPFEMLELKLHVKLPIFVARQWLRHRTANVNEYSARYSILDREFYVPWKHDLLPQSTTNRQGTGAARYEPREEETMLRLMREAAGDGFDTYDSLVEDRDVGGFGLAREQGRIVLPLSTYTQFYWKIDLHNLMHFLSLRADPHAQKEIRVYADLILSLVRSWVPTVHEAFVDYRLGAHTFSRQEMEQLRKLARWAANTPMGLPAPEGLSDREAGEFFAALGMGAGV